MKKLILSVDLDDYWCTHPNSQNSFLESSIENMINYFEKFNIKATFFCVAKDEKVLKNYIPELINKGHEVANHSYSHQYNQLLSFDKKKLEIERSTEILSDIAQQRIRGYRAPGWGYDNDVGNLLNRLGYSYDASTAVSPLFIILRLYHTWKFKKKTYIYGSFRENLGFIQKSHLKIVPLRQACLLPFYGSFHLYAPNGMNFFKLQKNVIKDRKVVNYIFHAFDFYKNENNYSFQLTKKKNHDNNLETIISEISKDRNSTTYFDFLSSEKT